MAERASPFAGAVDTEAHGIAVSAPPRGSCWQIACWPESFARTEAALADALGADAPQPGRVSLGTASRRLIRVEPLKWWVLGADGAACPIGLAAEDGAVLDLSHDQAALEVAGPHAAEMLKRFVSIDLRDRAFPDLSYATTMAHHMIVRVLRQDRNGMATYEVMVMRSYANDLAEILKEHLEHFG